MNEQHYYRPDEGQIQSIRTKTLNFRIFSQYDDYSYKVDKKEPCSKYSTVHDFISFHSNICISPQNNNSIF